MGYVSVYGQGYQCSHPTWKTFKICNFVIFFSRPGKWLEFAQKVVKTWNFNSKPEKLEICKFYVSSFTFQDVIYKNNSDLHLCHIHIINTNTVIQRQIDLGFHCFYLEITWKIHGILCHQRSGNPGYHGYTWGNIEKTIIYFIHWLKWTKGKHSQSLKECTLFGLQDIFTILNYCIIIANFHNYCQQIHNNNAIDLFQYLKNKLKIELYVNTSNCSIGKFETILFLYEQL